MYVEATPTGPIQLDPAAAAAAAAGQAPGSQAPAGPTPPPHAHSAGDYGVITPGGHPGNTGGYPATGNPAAHVAAGGPASWLPQPQNAPERGSADRTPHTAQALIRRPDQAMAPQETPQTALTKTEKPGRVLQAQGWVRERAKVVDVKRLPEVVTAAQPSLADRISYSTKGEWTTRSDGAARVAHRTWTYVVTVPVTAGAYLLAWAVERPARCAFLALVALLAGTALAQVPIVEFLIPDFVNVLSWL